MCQLIQTLPCRRYKHSNITLKSKKFMTDKGMLFSFNYTTQRKTYKTLQN